MTTVCRSFPDEAGARRGIESLRAEGVPERDLLLMTGTAPHDIRREPVGSFAGRIGPGAHVGTFANVRCLRGQGTGSFAGNADRQRKGSFADTDRDVIVTYEGGAEHPRACGDAEIRRLLAAAAVRGAAADRIVDDLHAGRSVVLAEVAEIAPREARECLNRVAEAR
jgi:hypothetical protein